MSIEELRGKRRWAATIVAWFTKLWWVTVSKGRSTARESWKLQWPMKAKYYEKDNMKNKHPAWIVPTLFCVTRHINIIRYLMADGAHRMLKTIFLRKHNVMYVKCSMWKNPRHLTSHKLRAFKAFQNIEYGETFSWITGWVHRLPGIDCWVSCVYLYYYLEFCANWNDYTLRSVSRNVTTRLGDVRSVKVSIRIYGKPYSQRFRTFAR